MTNPWFLAISLEEKNKDTKREKRTTHVEKDIDKEE